jgi:hypothetical protein
MTLACLTALPVSANDSTAASTEASQASLAAGGAIVDGSVAMLRAGATLSIVALASAGDASIVVLRDVATGAQMSMRIARDVAREGALAIGEGVHIVGEATGYSLVVAGRLVAFIPNEAGRALVYHARSTQR